MAAYKRSYIFKEHHHRGVRVVSGCHSALVRVSRARSGDHRALVRGSSRTGPGVIAHWSGGHRALVRGSSRICSRGHARPRPGGIAHWSGGHRASAPGGRALVRGPRATSGGHRALVRSMGARYSSDYVVEVPVVALNHVLGRLIFAYSFAQFYQTHTNYVHLE
ncbi:hypothetical protein CPSG_10176 [Coccidioides posadasii str. Silveira]|uniref:Uncharacterized protein n=1 Tax=Coccidioides posadasii (strain RMSCC 757 / Silveira) TaxID=443226 RepID=E9DK27_COCPS|nr:hypothetical protein CPSG_10176 [Coccidioides posadasii str. Silveira]